MEEDWGDVVKWCLSMDRCGQMNRRARRRASGVLVQSLDVGREFAEDDVESGVANGATGRGCSAPVREGSGGMGVGVRARLGQNVINGSCGRSLVLESSGLVRWRSGEVAGGGGVEGGRRTEDGGMIRSLTS